MIQFELSPEEGSSVENERITFINQRKEDERILPESTDAPSTQYLKEPPLNEKYHSSSQNIYTPPRNPPEPCQPEPQRTPPRASKGSTVWEVYNHEAKAVDNEMVKDWTSSLNSMLVFVSLPSLSVNPYSEVLGNHLCGCIDRVCNRKPEAPSTRFRRYHG